MGHTMSRIQNGDVGIWDEHSMGYCVMIFAKVSPDRMIGYLYDGYENILMVKVLDQNFEDDRWNDKELWISSGWKFV